MFLHTYSFTDVFYKHAKERKLIPAFELKHRSSQPHSVLVIWIRLSTVYDCTSFYRKIYEGFPKDVYGLFVVFLKGTNGFGWALRNWTKSKQVLSTLPVPEHFMHLQ